MNLAATIAELREVAKCPAATRAEVRWLRPGEVVTFVVLFEVAVAELLDALGSKQEGHLERWPSSTGSYGGVCDGKRSYDGTVAVLRRKSTKAAASRDPARRTTPSGEMVGMS